MDMPNTIKLTHYRRRSEGTQRPLTVATIVAGDGGRLHLSRYDDEANWHIDSCFAPNGAPRWVTSAGSRYAIPHLLGDPDAGMTGSGDILGDCITALGEALVELEADDPPGIIVPCYDHACHNLAVGHPWLGGIGLIDGEPVAHCEAHLAMLADPNAGEPDEDRDLFERTPTP